MVDAADGGAAPITGDAPAPVANGQSEFTYYYHPDHLGSTGYVTDANGKLYEHMEYFPFGESWVQEHSNTLRTPYLFTGKELDQETGLYYFGARYYDPRTSVWQSADPILDKYLPSGGKTSNLAGMGGAFNTFNLNLYAYSHQSPVVYKDPDGKETYSGTRDLANVPIGSHGMVVIITTDPKQYGKFERNFQQYTNVSGDVPVIKRGETFYAAMLSGGPSNGMGGKLKKELNQGLDPEAMQELAGTYNGSWYQFWDQDLTLKKVEPQNGKTELQADMDVLQRFDNYKDNESYAPYATGDSYNCFGFREGLLNQPDKGWKNEWGAVDPGINKSVPSGDFQ